MTPVKTKEQLIYFMQSGYFRLSRHDLQFIRNLNYLVLSNRSLTTNQVDLFEKLIKKYNKQLDKHGINITMLDNLIWETTTVPSLSEFTEAYISISDDKIIFKSPFNKKFLDKFSKISYNSFTWVKDKKRYESFYSTEALKNIVSTANNYFSVVNYCKVVTKLLESIDQYTQTVWTPTLTFTNGNYLISAINEPIYNATLNLQLSDEPGCLATLASYGVEIEPLIVKNDPLLSFASKYIVEVDYTNLEELINYLRAVNCDAIITSGIGLASHYQKSLIKRLRDSNFYLEEHRSSKSLTNVIKNKKNPILIHMSSFIDSIPSASNFRKIIKLKNSTQIEFR